MMMSTSYAYQIADRAVWSMAKDAEGGGVDVLEHDLSDQAIACAKDCWEEEQVAAARALKAAEAPFRDKSPVLRDEDKRRAEAPDLIMNDIVMTASNDLADIIGSPGFWLRTPDSGGDIGGIGLPLLPVVPGSNSQQPQPAGPRPDAGLPDTVPPVGLPETPTIPAGSPPPVEIPAPAVIILLGLGLSIIGGRRYLGERRATR